MTAVTVINLIFAGITLVFAWRAIRHAVPFIRLGWMAVSAAAEKGDYSENVERRRAISEGGRLMLGGLLWLLIGIGAAGLGLFFLWRALAPSV